MGGVVDSDYGVVQAAPDALDGLARWLGGAADTVAGTAGGVDRSVPAVPEDEHGVARLIVAFDEARERFERRVAETLRGSGAYLGSVSSGARQADQFALAPSGTGRP
jgi:hypothetical protein